MQNETMPEQESVQPISMLLLPSPALLLAEGIAEAEAKAPRLRAQQEGVEKSKRRHLRKLLRHLRSAWRKAFPSGGPLHSGKIYRTAQTRQSKRRGQSCGSLHNLPSEKEEGGE